MKRWIPSEDRDVYLMLESSLREESEFAPEVSPVITLYTRDPRPEGHVPVVLVGLQQRIQAERIGGGGPVDLAGEEFYMNHYRTAPVVQAFWSIISLEKAGRYIYVDRWKFKLQLPVNHRFMPAGCDKGPMAE